MKNTIRNTKKGILMVALLATVTGFANNAKRDAKKTAVVIENVKEGNLLTLKDVYGITLYKEAIATNGIYKKGFDLSELPNGDYLFELEKDLEIKTIPFTVSSNKVSFNKTDESTYFKPYVREANGLVYVSKLNPSSADTTIKVYAIDIYGESRLSFTEVVENSQIVEKVFKLEKGNYKIEIHSDNKEYTTFINN
ncbi:hypothetical protein [Algibacter sp.]|uniref:hypothetical protein n=1 Tax=Algibacter sp. TaxID=1872428 RepID=UPI003C71932C